MCETLEKLGLSIEQVHAESGSGQMEIALGHAPALDAADGLLLAREAIMACAARHELKASFLPKYRADQAGNGCHVHFSIWKDGRNLISLPTPHTPLSSIDFQTLSLDPIMTSFLAGIYTHLPSLMCFTTPTPNSFRRLQPNCWAGAFQIWGYGNKESPIRIPIQTAVPGLFTNFEVKLNDATANPHVALAAIVASGLVGLDESMVLPSPTQIDPGMLNEADREAKGIRRLPSDFASAKSHLMEVGSSLRAYLGEEVIQCLIAVRESEWTHMVQMPLEKEVKLLFDRY